MTRFQRTMGGNMTDSTRSAEHTEGVSLSYLQSVGNTLSHEFTAVYDAFASRAQ